MPRVQDKLRAGVLAADVWVSWMTAFGSRMLTTGVVMELLLDRRNAMRVLNESDANDARTSDGSAAGHDSELNET
jgi:hypothetical protein